MMDSNVEEGTVVKAEKISGTIKNFLYYRGFGYITPNDEPDTEVFALLKNFIGYDEEEQYPVFPKETPVEFVKKKDAKGWTALEISQPGGAKLVSQTEDPGKNYNRDVVYTGTVHFFHYRTGYGYITCDEEKITWGGETSELRKVTEPKEEGVESEERFAASIWFPAEEIVGEENTKKELNVGDRVEFNVYVDKKGLGAGKVVLTSEPSERKRKGNWSEPWPRKKTKTKRKSVDIADMGTYLFGNYRGALQEFFQQMENRVETTYETDKDPEDEDLFLSTARTIGYKDDLIEGCGRETNKKGAIKAAALDLIMKLGLISEEQHINLQNTEDSQSGE